MPWLTLNLIFRLHLLSFSLPLMPHPRPLPNTYQAPPTYGVSTSYLTPSYPCQNCHRVDHVTERCPNPPRSHEKIETGSFHPAHGPPGPTQPQRSFQRSYLLNGNQAGFQTSITPSSQ